MSRKSTWPAFLLLTAATGLLSLLAAASFAAAHATPTSGSDCARAAVMKTVFPKAVTAGFMTRWRIARTGRRHPYFEGWCGSWATTYSDYRGLPERHGLRPYRAFAEVGISLYETHRDALVALDEPAFGSRRMLPNGARIRTLVSAPSVDGDASRQVGAVASVIGNVFVLSTGQGRPPAYQGHEAVTAQMRIHRRIHAAVLGLG